MAQRLDWLASRSTGIGGSMQVPGDKSISHRAVMLGALADGVTDVSNFLTGADCRATATAMRAMGVRIDEPAADRLRIHGVGVDGLDAPSVPLDLGNSGTSMRLLSGILAGQSFSATLTGDESLNRRPMRRVTDPLTQMGARFDTTAAGTAPLTVHGQRPLRALRYALPMASAQVKSAVLLAGLFADGSTVVTEPATTRDHTERMLTGLGYAVDVAGNRIALVGGGRLRASTIAVPGDISSAAFFFVAAAIQPGAEITARGVGVNPTRIGILSALAQMGAEVEISNPRLAIGEPVADVTVRGRPLQGIEIGADLVALAIDELPALFIAAACARGETRVTGAEELRVKESDRVASMAAGLAALGIRAEPQADGIRIQGGRIGGGTVESCSDHRVAMSFAVAGQVATGPVRIRDCANVATSFPGFAETACGVGFALRTDEVSS